MKVIGVCELLAELAAMPELQDDPNDICVVWEDVEAPPCRNRNAVQFYAGLHLRIEPMYFQGEEVGFASITSKNRYFQPKIEVVGELYDDYSQPV